ncbi:MAG: zinc ribbon domain-containing protein [Bacteroidales bacterium]|nr:zinc ribbon domain-containing protein [Bacteroidales bacterium]
MMLVDLGLYTILNSTLILLDDRYFLEDSLPRFIGAILGGLIVLVPIWFYLCRRRPLFKPYINNESQYNIAKTSKKQNPNTHIMICPQCGTVYSCQPGKWNCKHCNSLLIDININKSAWELMSVSKRNELIKKICPSFGKSESNYTSSPASNNVRSQIAQQNPDFKQVIKDEKVTKITDDSMQSIIGKCASCNHELKKGWIVCPNCGEPVKQLCPQCKAEIKDSWKICPFCGEKLK